MTHEDELIYLKWTAELNLGVYAGLMQAQQHPQPTKSERKRMNKITQKQKGQKGSGISTIHNRKLEIGLLLFRVLRKQQAFKYSRCIEIVQETEIKE